MRKQPLDKTAHTHYPATAAYAIHISIGQLQEPYKLDQHWQGAINK